MRLRVLASFLVAAFAAACSSASPSPAPPNSDSPDGEAPPRPHDDAGAGDARATGDDGGGTDDDPSVIGDPNDPRFADVLSFAKSDTAASGVVGAAVAIVVGGKLTFAAGVGDKKKGAADPVRAGTLFRVGSMTKMTVGATVQSLAQEGKIDVSRPVTTYVPALRLAQGFDPSTITVKEALTHTAGLPDDYSQTCATGPGSVDAWFDQQLYPLWAPPAAVWDYSNVGFALAGLVAEHAGGRPLEQLIHDRVFVPANMKTATFDITVAQAADHAVGYETDPMTMQEKSFDANAYDCGWVHAPGGLFASVIDYAHLAETMLAGGGAMLGAQAMTEMASGQVETREGGGEKYGYGLIVDTHKGLARVWHDGAIDGFQSTMWTIPEKKFAVIVFINSFDATPERIASHAADVFLGLPPGDDPLHATPPSTWVDYVGGYDDTTGGLGHIDVALNGQKLGATFTAPGLQPLTSDLPQITDDTFYIVALDLPVTFWREADNTIKYFVTRGGVGLRKGGAPVPGARAPARATHDPAYFRARAKR